jgi:hypothetical protein
MRTALVCLLTFPVLFACSGTPSPGKDAGPMDSGTDEVFFKVTGTAKIHPIAADYLNDAGIPASFVGLTARVEEPLKVALSQPEGVFSTQILDSSGAFQATNISSLDVSLAVAAGIFDGMDAGRVVRSATILYDVSLQSGQPKGDITGIAYAVPTPFHDKLTATITPAKIHGITKDTDAGTLIEAGFILGRVIDAAGKPVAGKTITPSPANLQGGFFYPGDDLTTLGTSTASNGLFVYVHNGGDVNQFSFAVTGESTYKKRNAGATHDACLVVDIYPGTVAP